MFNEQVGPKFAEQRVFQNHIQNSVAEHTTTEINHIEQNRVKNRLGPKKSKCPEYGIDLNIY